MPTSQPNTLPAEQENLADWYSIGTTLRPILQAAHRSQRTPIYAAKAAELGVSLDYLRRFIPASEFIDEVLSSPGQATRELGQSLSELSVSAVELIARWSKYDRNAALSAARQAATGDLTVYQLKQAEKSARSHDQSVRFGRAGAMAFRTRIGPQIREELASESGLPQLVDGVGPTDLKGPDFVFKSTDGHRTAVVVYGPYREEKMYADLASDFMLKLLGLTHGYDKIVAVMPTGVHQDHFDAHLKRLVESKIEFRHFDKDTLEMLPPEMPTMTP